MRVGAVVSMLAIVWRQELVLPAPSVATQVRVATKVLPQPRLVTVLRTEITTTPQSSSAVGVSKPRLPPHSLVLLPKQLMKGADLSVFTVTVVVQVAVQSLGSITE